MPRSIRRAAVLALALAGGCGKPAGRTVHFYSWDSYDDPAVFAEFEKRTGIKVVTDFFASNEELLAKLMAGQGGYDVIVPSDYMVEIMARQGLLAEIPRAAVPNAAQLDPRFLDLPFDKGNRFSMPYMWGMTGIAYDSDVVKPAPDSWAALWDPRWKGRIAMLNDQREVFAMALQSLRLPANSKDPVHLAAAQKRLAEQRPLVKAYQSENQKGLLIAGEVVMAQAWSSDLNLAAAEKPSLRFVLPKEGGFIWMDNLCIPKGAADPEAAKALVDFLLSPEVAVKLHAKLRGGSPIKDAARRLPEELRGNPTIVPDAAMMKRAVWLEDLGEAAALYDRLWTELKAG